jgi:hypothetical protein
MDVWQMSFRIALIRAVLRGSPNDEYCAEFCGGAYAMLFRGSSIPKLEQGPYDDDVDCRRCCVQIGIWIIFFMKQEHSDMMGPE